MGRDERGKRGAARFGGGRRPAGCQCALVRDAAPQLAWQLPGRMAGARSAVAAAAASAAVAVAAYYFLSRRRRAREVISAFERDGIAVVRGFASLSECQEMLRAMDVLVEEWDPTTTTSVFKTDSSQTSAQGKDDYFMSSGDAVCTARQLPLPVTACTLTPSRVLLRLRRCASSSRPARWTRRLATYSCQRPRR